MEGAPQRHDPVEEKQKFDRDYHDHHNTDPDALERTLFAALDVINELKIPYGLIGGLAVKGLGRPRVTNDIDIFVSPDDAERVLPLFKQHGFETEKRDPHWLYKAWKEDVLVDIIFKSTGDIYFDEEMQNRVRKVVYHQHEVKVVSPEDFVVIKSAAHQEHSPHHWHDALAVLIQGDLDWDYLLRRSRHSPRRVLSLLIYAQSNDTRIPDDVVRSLFRSLYDSRLSFPAYESRVETPVQSRKNVEPLPYLKAKIREALARDPKTADQDLDLFISGSVIVVRGRIFTLEQKKAVTEVISSVARGFSVDNQMILEDFATPEESEVVL